MNVLVLHSRLSGYWMACLKAFANNYGGNITVVRKKASANAPFIFSEIKGISLHQFDSFTDEQLMEFGVGTKPDLVYVSGWSEQIYLKMAEYFYKTNIPVLCGLDTQAQNSLRQKAGFIYLKYVLSDRFSHLWIPGLYQFEVARKLGFAKENILTGLYSADVPVFSKGIKTEKPDEYPKSFIFLGRLVARKGVRELLQAFDRLKKQDHTNWTLTVVGSGPLKNEVQRYSNIDYINFVQPKEIPELLPKHGVFVLPSRAEPWGVVIHEAAAAGLPIICTRQCGAATAFLRDGYNGFFCKAGSANSLYAALKRTTQISDTDLFNMGQASADLSRQFTPAMWAATLNRLIQNKNAE